jgi:hypothetical protein
VIHAVEEMRKHLIVSVPEVKTFAGVSVILVKLKWTLRARWLMTCMYVK